MKINYNFFEEHFNICSNRTKNCQFCKKYVILKNFVNHEKICYENFLKKINCSNCKELIDRPFKYILGNSYFCDKFEIFKKKNKLKKKNNKKISEKKNKTRICYYCMKPISSYMYDMHLEICKLSQIEENKNKNKKDSPKKKNFKKKNSLKKKKIQDLAKINSKSKNSTSNKHKIKNNNKNHLPTKKFSKEFSEIKKISITKDLKKNLKIKCEYCEKIISLNRKEKHKNFCLKQKNNFKICKKCKEPSFKLNKDNLCVICIKKKSEIFKPEKIQKIFNKKKNNGFVYKDIMGSMNEDEALARAIQESMP